MKKLVAEFLGTTILMTVIVGSGIMAANLSPDKGVELFINIFSIILALAILILVFGPISGAHFNPVVTLSDWIQKRISALDFIAYALAQLAGAYTGAVIANLMFKHPAFEISHHIRSGANLFVGEMIATAGLLFLIERLRDLGKLSFAPVAVAAWIGSACFFTSSTSFANPAVTFGRGFTESYTGIALNSVPLFVLAQILGAGLGVVAGRYFITNSNQNS